MNRQELFKKAAVSHWAHNVQKKCEFCGSPMLKDLFVEDKPFSFLLSITTFTVRFSCKYCPCVVEIFITSLPE